MNELIAFHKSEQPSILNRLNLCERCDKVRWSYHQREHAVFLLAHRLKNEPIEQLAGTDCCICRFLVSATMSWTKYSAYQGSVAVLDIKDIQGRLVAEFNHLNPISCIQIRSQVAECERIHENVMRPEPVQGLKVIDCKSRVVVPASEGCKYAALSYVWGEAKSGTNLEFPATIEDAISITRALGLGYLWVDRYCIDQENATEKHSQIQQMGLIYSRAQITIIAAAGRDPDHGLPGVSKQFLPMQPDSNPYESKHLHFDGELRSSTWASRAWTYQGCFLSQRRLIFTDHHLVLSCNKDHYQEMVTMTKWSRADIGYYIRSLVPRISIEDSRIDSNKTFQQYLEEYCKRDMSYRADALNACLGIFQYTRQTTGIDHIWGIPFQVEDGKVLFSLSWTHRHPYSVGRRSNFPSWPWTGWEGPIDFFFLTPFLHCDAEAYDADEECFMSLNQYEKKGRLRYYAGRPDAPKSIRVTGLVLKDIQYENCDSELVAIIPDVEFRNGKLLTMQVFLDQKVTNIEELSSSVALLILLNDDCGCDYIVLFFLILRSSDRNYERIGCIQGSVNRGWIDVHDVENRTWYKRWEKASFILE